MPQSAIVAKMEIWARWCVKRNPQLGYGKNVFARLIEGMPGTGCPTCGGRGRAPGAVFGVAQQYVKCETCNGAGRVKLNKTSGAKINPALINPTKPPDFSNELAEKIDYIVKAICTERDQEILNLEYFYNGRQQDKAKRLKISQGYYSTCLTEAHDTIEDNLKKEYK